SAHKDADAVKAAIPIPTPDEVIAPVARPSTLPSASNTGPPLLPGLTVASIAQSEGVVFVGAETTPAETRRRASMSFSAAPGLPTTRTGSPTSGKLHRSFAGLTGARSFIRTTAAS